MRDRKHEEKGSLCGHEPRSLRREEGSLPHRYTAALTGSVRAHAGTGRTGARRPCTSFSPSSPKPGCTDGVVVGARATNQAPYTKEDRQEQRPAVFIFIPGISLVSLRGAWGALSSSLLHPEDP